MTTCNLEREGRGLGYLAISTFVLLSYVLVIGRYSYYVNHVIPTGDPYTYTVGWFQKITLSQANYWQTLSDIIHGPEAGWYRLQNLLVAAFGPLLSKDPAIICVVNYFLWGIATAEFFRMGYYLGLSNCRAFLIALVPWIWPTNYGFYDHHSMPVLALDAAFTAALHLALASALIFALDPRLRRNALIAGLTTGIAIWGRGNSLPVVGLTVCCPLLIAFVKAWRSGDRNTWINIALVAVIAGGMIADFYITYWPALRSYYGAHVSFFERHAWSLSDAMPYLKNIPGFMYWRVLDSPWTMGLSWATHPVPLIALALAWRPGTRTGLFYLALTGAVIYYGTFVNLVLFNDPVISIQNSLLIWRPMLMGLSLSLISLLMPAFEKMPARFSRWGIAPYVAAALLLWGMVWTAILTPWWIGTDRPDPRVVEQFAAGIESVAGKGKQVAMLWYEGWNVPILNYYRTKNDLPVVPIYQPHHENMWSMSDYSPANAAENVAGVRDTFMNAAIVIMPEFMDDYADNQPYALYKFRREWGAWINSPDAPKMRVLMTLQDSPAVRLLVLQREDLAHGRGDPMRLPWGNRPAQPPADYSPAVIRVPLKM